jgi:3-hydroxyacyl-CoA dehydrogenase
MVDAKFLGKKTGKGFYLHAPASAKKSSSEKMLNPEAEALLKQYRPATTTQVSPQEVAERMVLRFMKECMHSLEDGIIKSPADGDIGAVFGLGFPPFLGGPFRYADILGASKVADNMSKYADKHGAQFAPPQSLVDLAKTGKTFHSK